MLQESEESRICEQTGFGRSTALFSSARSRLTSRISPWCATLVWSTHGLVSAFFHVGRQFGTSRPNTLACGLRKRPWSFLMGVTIVTPNIYILHTVYWQIYSRVCCRIATSAVGTRAMRKIRIKAHTVFLLAPQQHRTANYGS